MKYFKLELLDKSPNFSDSEYEISDKLWKENLKAYWEKFKEYKYRLPSRFVREDCNHVFHDYEVESINFYKDFVRKNKCYIVELKVHFDDNVFIIKYINVIKIQLSLSSMNSIGENILICSELLPVSDTIMSHEILFVDRNTLYIEFKKLAFKKL